MSLPLLVPKWTFHESETALRMLVRHAMTLTRWGTFMPLPNTYISVVVGSPIEVPRVEGHVSDELVNATLARYTEALTALFERHKAKYARFPDEYLHIR